MLMRPRPDPKHNRSVELPELVVPDAGGWRTWLGEHHHESPGVWLVLAKKGTSEPTTLTYEQALEEAVCHGWIDGQAGRRDEGTYRQRFTPRRRRSAWSQRNAAIADRLLAEGRMHPAGIEAIERAKGDGRWQAAYAGSASIDVPPFVTLLRGFHSTGQGRLDPADRNDLGTLFGQGSSASAAGYHEDGRYLPAAATFQR